MTANAVTTLTGSYRTTRMLVSDETDARIERCGCSCLPTRAAKGGLGARRDGHKFCRDGHETDKGHLEYRKDHRRATLRLSAYSVRAAEDCALPSADCALPSAGSALPSAGSALPSPGSALPSGYYAAAIRVLSTGSRRLRIAISRLRIAIGRQRIAISRQRIAIARQRIAIGVLRCGHPLGCEKLWGNREEDEGTGAADSGDWERKKRVDIAGWLCLHAFMIDHKKSGMLFTSLLHPSRCKPTCSMRHHERSRHQRR